MSGSYYKYYKQDENTYLVAIVIQTQTLLSGKINTTHEYICSTEEEVRALIVPSGHHLGDPGLTVTPAEVKGKTATECVQHNDKVHKGQKRVS